MGDESPGAMIRRARQEAGMKQRDLADRMGVHVTTVGYWERGKFFPEQHWAALNKLLHISLRPPESGNAAEPEPKPELDDDQELLETLRRVYRDDPDGPEKIRTVMRAVLEHEAQVSGRPARGPSSAA